MEKLILFIIAILISATSVLSQSHNGYDLWLTYHRIENQELLKIYNDITESIYIGGETETVLAAQRELEIGLEKLLGHTPSITNIQEPNSTLLIAKKTLLDPQILQLVDEDLVQTGNEGFVIKSITLGGQKVMVVTANQDLGILYGVFRLLNLMQQHQRLDELTLIDAPKIDLRMLNHWDNLDRTVERGYAGFSLWNWHTLPEFIDQRYIDYARANASIGINAASLTNVNANALILTPMYLKKVQALADVFRPYGIKVYLTARFSAPMEIGGLNTADPLEPMVQQWWNDKVKEIYALIPDFGGFLVKANSEGQPGPQNYGRNHVDGANMLAKASGALWR